MKNIINTLFPFIWSLSTVFLSTFFLLYFFSKIKLNKNTKKFFKLAYGLIVLIAIITILGSCVIYAIKRNNVFLIAEFLYEGFCWSVLIFSLIYIKKEKKQHLLKIKLKNKEKYLLIFSILFSFICIIILILNNKYYIFPQDIYGEIKNFYFNADIGRGIDSATSLMLPHIIHPTYRFVLYPIVMPISVVIRILSKFINNFSEYQEIILGYYLCFIQIIFNSISCLIFYKILNKLKISPKITLMGSIVLVISFSSVWLSIFPETYGITLVLLLLSIYLFQNKNDLLYAICFIAITTNPMVGVTLVPLLIFYIYKNKKNMLVLAKNYVLKFKLYIITSIIVLLIAISIVAIKFIQYILKWTNINNNFIKNMFESIEYLITTWFIGPQIDNINPYFVQTVGQSTFIKVFIFSLILSWILAVIKGRKNVIIISANITLMMAWLLHGVLGYGRYNGVIYAPLYSWAAILLVVYSIDNLFKSNNKKITLMLTIILTILVSNILWVYNIGNLLKNINFKTGNEVPPVEFYIKRNNGYEKYIIFNGNIIRYLDQKTIVRDVDCFRINSNDGSISGLINDSSWFEIYSENDNICINIQGDIKKIEGLNDIRSEFFIFGMGLRDKYIFTNKNNKWMLIDYYNNKTILENIICEEIDASNYKVKGYLENGIKFEIYEDQNGIFLKKGQDIQILDDGVYVNVPDFSGSRYEKELKILFNEIMVNITQNGPTPNFIAYPEVWYRDAAIIAMVLKETNNINHIEEWVNSIDKIYDEQNGNKEPDNLGQLLYILSLVDNPNEKLIEEILNEARNLKNGNKYINGITDGNKHPVYQTKWLIYGLKSLGLDYSEYQVPNIKDSYSSLIWFDNIEDIDSNNQIIETNDRWPYLYYARLNFYNEKLEFKSGNYPISSELEPSKANFDNLAVINEKLVENKLVVPHAWSAAEMFFYLLNLD